MDNIDFAPIAALMIFFMLVILGGLIAGIIASIF